MNIQAITSFHPIRTYNNPWQTKQPTFAAKSPKIDIVELETSPPYERALSKLNKINKEEYDSLTYEEKEALRHQLIAFENRLLNAGFLSEDLPMHHFAANSIKTVFDEQFGENNYVVITIGRSLSSISKLLEMKIGEENVKNIPLSHSDEYFAADSGAMYNQIIDKFTDKYGFEKFKKHLTSIGLDKKTVENSGKNYVIMDYCHTGKSLNGAYTILTSDSLLGNTKNNISVASIYNVTSLTDFSMANKLDHNLATMKYKIYSFVDKFYGKMTDLETALDYKKLGNKINQETMKLFGFALLDSQFSKNPIPNEVTLKKKYNNPNGKIWNSPETQFNIDTIKDITEIFKLTKRLERPMDHIRTENDFYDDPEVVKTKTNLINLSNKIRRQYYTMGQDDSFYSNDYYLIFRPALLTYLTEINEKYPAQNN